MNTKLSTNRKLKRMFANILSIIVMLAMAFPVTGGVAAEGEQPGLRAFPDQDRVDGSFWPVGELVYLTINGNELGGATADGTGYVEFMLTEYDLQRGDTLTLASGDISVTYTTRQLFVTDINLDAQTVSGTVDGQQTVHVWSGEAELYIDSNEFGNWLADFSGFNAVLFPGTCGNAEAWGEGPGSTIVDWCIPEPPPNPHFTVFPEWEFFDGLDWPDGATVTITVQDKPECETTKESWDGFFNGNFGEGCDIVFGDEVTFTDDTTTRTHIVQKLYVTEVDMGENTVMGKADAGATIYVWPHDGWFEPLQTIVGGSGVWQVDLDDAGYTVREDSEGRSEIRDEKGNATASDWHVTHPHFTVFPEWEWFDGLDWPNEAMVNITVGGKPLCETTKESWSYFFNGGFPEGCDVAIGDIVTFTDGETFQTHTVQNLTVTKANQADNTIKGIADPGAEVYVWPHATGEQQLAIAKTQGAAMGKWSVDFSGIYDLTPGECGRSEIRDGFANSTAVDWCISNPRIVASESGDWFWTTEFKPGDLEISIYDSPNVDANLLWSGQQVADESGFTFVGSDIHGQDLLPGNTLVVTDGDSQKSLVLQPIFVTVFDTENEIMAGFAPAGSEVWAAAGPQDWQERIMAMADPVSGEWFADFADIGFDITEDMRPWSYAHIYDEDGDANEGSTPPPPVIFAHPAYNFVEGTQWTPGAEATVMIDDPTSAEGTDYSDTQMVDSDSSVRFGLEFDLQAGHIITMTDGHNTRTMTVSNLQVTGFNLDAHTVFGVGDSGSEFFIADNGMPVSVNGDGNWSVTYDELTPGSWWTIIQRYEDGNEMRETFRAPMPMMIAWKNWDDVAGSEWTPGVEVTLTIDDPSNGQGVDYTFTEFAVDSGNLYYGNVYFNLGIEVQTGYVLTMSDGNFTKTLVLSALTVTGYNFDTHTIYGTGDPGTQLLVHLGGQASEPVTVGDDHTWSVYHELLEPGIWFDTIQSDEDGDQTRDGGQAL